jgi:uncharacterized DUF497 family protein
VAGSVENWVKHGINFDQIQAIWGDVDALEVPAQVLDGEYRFMVIGKIKGKYWSAIITYRNNKIRIISARRSRKSEEVHYEENQNRDV